MTLIDSKILDYVRNEIRKGRYPTGTKLHKIFRIYERGLDLYSIYSNIGIDPLKISHRSNKMRKDVKLSLLRFLKKEVMKGKYPSLREIKNNFHLDFYQYFDNVEQYYKEAGVTYKRVENQDIKFQKAQKLLNLSKKIIQKSNFKILESRGVNQRGIDILIETPFGKAGVEIKAYNKFERVKKKDLEQIKRFTKEEKLVKTFLFTTTDRIPKIIPRGITIFSYNQLKKFLSPEDITILKEIRYKSVHQETEDRKLKKNIILNFVKENAKRNRFVGVDEILKEKEMYVYSYFKNMDEVYKQSKVKINLLRLKYLRNKILKNEEKQKIENQILSFIKKEVRNGHYPSGIDIGRVFGVKHIWNYWKVNSLYKKLNLPTYLERKSMGLS